MQEDLNLKRFNGTYYEKTDEIMYRNPKDKTVYVVGSYAISRIELYVNGILLGECNTPRYTFIFAFDHVIVDKEENLLNGEPILFDGIYFGWK